MMMEKFVRNHEDDCEGSYEQIARAVTSGLRVLRLGVYKRRALRPEEGSLIEIDHRNHLSFSLEPSFLSSNIPLFVLYPENFFSLCPILATLSGHVSR